LDAKKEKLMLDLKSKCAELGKNWSEELQKSRNEVARLKAENQAAKQVNRCTGAFARQYLLL